MISSVFPKPLLVFEFFIQRTFEQLIQGYLETLLTFADSHSSSAYLMSLEASYSGTNQLIGDLKRLFERLGQSTGPGSSSSDSDKPSSSIVNRLIEDVFVHFTDFNRYVEKEKKAADDIFQLLLNFLNQAIVREYCFKEDFRSHVSTLEG